MLAVSFTDARTKPVLVSRPSDLGQIKIFFSSSEKFIDDSGVVVSRSTTHENSHPFNSVNFRTFMLEQLLVMGVDSLNPSSVVPSRTAVADKVDSILDSLNS